MVAVLGWLDVSLSVLTTRTVVRWAGAAESSLTWTFMHRSRFRFPHCKTKSDDVVCLVLISELALNNPPSLLVLPLLLLLNKSLSISFCKPPISQIRRYFASFSRQNTNRIYISLWATWLTFQNLKISCSNERLWSSPYKNLSILMRNVSLNLLYLSIGFRISTFRYQILVNSEPK